MIFSHTQFSVQKLNFKHLSYSNDYFKINCLERKNWDKKLYQESEIVASKIAYIWPPQKENKFSFYISFMVCSNFFKYCNQVLNRIT